MGTDLVMNALHGAFHAYRPLPGLAPHSGRGRQYCGHACQEKMKKYRTICSISRKGDCYGNAPTESFWGLLKTERVHRRRYSNHAEAIRDITEYTEIFYNR